MRGLKRVLYLIYNNISKSHLLQMRGLKPLSQPLLSSNGVASFTDAWIETKLERYTQEEYRRIFYRCVD